MLNYTKSFNKRLRCRMQRLYQVVQHLLANIASSLKVEIVYESVVLKGV